jgi:hypothetical protein
MKTFLPALLISFFFYNSIQAQYYTGIVPNYAQLIVDSQSFGLNCLSPTPDIYFNLDADTSQDAQVFGSANCSYPCSMGTCWSIADGIHIQDSTIQLFAEDPTGSSWCLSYTQLVIGLPLNNRLSLDFIWWNSVPFPASSLYWGSFGFLHFDRKTLSCVGSSLSKYVPFYDRYIIFRKKYLNSFYLYGWVSKPSQIGSGVQFGNYTQLPAHASQIFDTIACSSSYTFVDSLTLSISYKIPPMLATLFIQ